MQRLIELKSVITLVDPSETSEAEAAILHDRFLDEDEQNAAQRFVRAEERHQYIAARALVRFALSEAFPVAVREWRFERDQHGKPFFVGPRGLPAFRFSLSHTRGLIALLLTLADEAGVDVETMERTNDLELVAQRVCSAAELDSLGRLSGDEWKTRFFQLWTLKEAFAKARGVGLALPLQSISFEIDEQGNATADLPREATGWQFWLQTVTDNHILAAALRSGAKFREIDVRKVRLTSSSLAV